MSSSFDIFLKLDGIDGESTVKGHERETVVLSYEQIIDDTIVMSGDGGGASVGKSTFSGVRFRKPLDVGSIPLRLTCAAGTHIATATFTFRRSATSLDFYVVKLDGVLVTHVAERAGDGPQFPLSFDTLANGADHTGFLEEITVRFSRIQWKYVPVDARGDATPPIIGGWDLLANARV
jgi:type VI secretion system secreted protein Hcp